MIYQNDKNGTAISGDIEALRQVVRNGKEIRIGWGFQHHEEKK
ncbi:MAG: hypothetical protein AAF149_24290 [Bacteroidota bacterium]